MLPDLVQRFFVKGMTGAGNFGDSGLGNLGLEVGGILVSNGAAKLVVAVKEEGWGVDLG